MDVVALRAELLSMAEEDWLRAVGRRT